MKILLIGVGGFGRRWCQAICNVKGVRLVALVDRSPKALRAAIETHKLGRNICYRDLERAIRETKPDIVVCSTPPAVHKECLEAAVRSGVHFLTEKPMSDNLRDARKMVDIAERANITFAVSQNYRYFPWNAKLGKLMQSGRYGRPGTVSIQFLLGHHMSGFRLKMPYVLTVDMSIHHFDLIRFILHDDPVSVMGRSWNPAWSKNEGDSCCNVIFEMRSGLLVHYLGSWTSFAASHKSWSGHWRIECDKATLFMEDDRVYTVKQGAEHLKEMKAPGCINGTQELVLNDFIKAIKARKEPATSGRDNLKSLSMVFGSIESFRKNGRRIGLSE